MTFTCYDCKQEKPVSTSGGTGYAVLADEHQSKVCYDCCANRDKAHMVKEGRITLYLTVQFNGQSTLTNWPGTLSFPIAHVKIGRHNIARHQYHVWFTFNGQTWHGVRYGDNTQICECKRVKGGK